MVVIFPELLTEVDEVILACFRLHLTRLFPRVGNTVSRRNYRQLDTNSDLLRLLYHGDMGVDTRKEQRRSRRQKGSTARLYLSQRVLYAWGYRHDYF